MLEYIRSIIEDVIVAISTGFTLYGDEIIGVLGSCAGLLFVFFKALQKKRESETARIEKETAQLELERKRQELEQYKKLVEDYDLNRLSPDLLRKVNNHKTKTHETK